jgi:hypothetical protein
MWAKQMDKHGQPLLLITNGDLHTLYSIRLVRQTTTMLFPWVNSDVERAARSHRWFVGPNEPRRQIIMSDRYSGRTKVGGERWFNGGKEWSAGQLTAQGDSIVERNGSTLHHKELYLRTVTCNEMGRFKSQCHDHDSPRIEIITTPV